jgi:PAS domain S-box-containing protein
LIIEDELIEAMSFEQSLKSVGFEVVGISSTGKDALVKVAELKPDLVLMDIILKGDMDGIETAAKINENYDIPIVYLTAHPEKSTVDRAKLTSPYGYLIKPVNITVLKNTVDMVLYKHRTDQKLKESEKRFKASFNQAPVGMVLSGADRRIFKANKKFIDMIGYSNEELQGQLFYKLTYADDLEISHKAVKSLFSGEKEKINLIKRYVHKDGHIIWADVNVVLFHDENQNPLFFISHIQDITKRKKSETALKKSERLLADMFDFLPDATFAIDHEGKVIAWNRALEEMTGYLKEDMLGKGDYEYAIPWYGIRRPILIDLIGDEDSIYAGKYDFIDIEGQTLKAEVFVPSLYGGRGAYVWVKASKLLDHNGRMYGAIESVRDITDRKEAENRLKKSEQRFRAVAESAVDGIVTTDHNGEILFYNESLGRIFGYSIDELIGANLTILMPDRLKDDYLKGLKIYKESGEHRRLGKTLKTRGLRKDGTEFSFEMSLSAWRSGGRNFFTSIIRDITERKKAEKALKNSKSFLNSIIDQSPHPMWISDSEGYIIRINQACLDLLNITREEVMGNYNIFKDDIVEEQGCMPLVRSVFEEGRTVNFDLVYDSIQLKHMDLKNYVHVILDVTIFPIKDALGRVTNAVIQHRNITEIKKAEIRIKKSLEEKEILLKEIHHRVKNNLQIVSSVLDLQGSYVKTDPIAVNVLKESQNRVFSMALIHEMLYQSKDLNKINFDDYIKSLISHLLHSYRLEIQVNSVIDVKDVSLNIETAVPCGLIISELVSNSLKYAFENEKSGEVQISLKSKGNEYELIVSDNGVGFPENLDIKNIKLSLGLQLVNALVNQLDGSIELDRSQGTRYTIKFKEQIYKNRLK